MPLSSAAISGSNSSLSSTSLRISQQLPNFPVPSADMPALPSLLCRLGQLLRLGDRLFDSADHVECLLRQVVVNAGAQTLEALDGVGELHEHAGQACKVLGHMHGLRQIPLDLAR